ncbi:MAG: TetR/AcrR family transcriptional regulator [Rhizobiaceae bacterium]|nr:TetR/AcrR family transcriptional regulator [Rhizobiaceae bacterium]
MTKRDAAKSARRRLIVESAAMCFIEGGFHQTSIRDIANKAGISLGNLYNHFESKAALIAEIASLEAEGLGEIEKNLRASSAPGRRMEKFIHSYFDYASQPHNAVLAAEITAEAMRNPDIAKGFVQNRKWLVEQIATVLEGGKQQAEFTFDQQPADLANLMIDLIESAGMRVAFSNRKLKTQTRKTVFEIIMKLLG